MTEGEILKVLPGWEIVRIIGSGGFGKVYEIKKVDGFGDVNNSALKVISIPESSSEIKSYRDDGYDDASITAIFKDRAENIADEFKLMSKLKGNSNIVSYEDHYIIPTDDNLGWDILIRMELLTTLPDYYAANFTDNGVDESAVARVGIDICKALELCAKHKIIHRDIKPQNIFINSNGDFKLGDFGVARTFDHTTQATKAGTGGYMAPEIHKGLAYDSTIDIYSLGLVLYWMLNDRKLPFLPGAHIVPTTAQKEDAFRRRISGEQFPRAVHSSTAMHDIICKACAYEPGQRFQNPTELRLELESLLSASADFEFDSVTMVVPSTASHSHTDNDSNFAYAYDDDDDDDDDTDEYLSVRFLDEDGSVIERKEYKRGEKLILPPNPQKAEDGEYRYSFVEWTPKPEPLVNREATYTAVFAKEKIISGDNLDEGGGGGKKRKPLIPIIIGALACIALIVVLCFVLPSFKNKGGTQVLEESTHSSTPTVVETPQPMKEGESDEIEQAFSDWTETLPGNLNINNSNIETKTAYRSAPLHLLEEETEGYTFHSSVAGDWGEWSSWQGAKVEKSDTVDVKTSVSYYYKTGEYQYITNATHTATEREWVVSDWIFSATPVSVGGTIVDVSVRTQYSYRERTVENYYTKDDSWSDYSETPIKAEEGTAVEKCTLYRYTEIPVEELNGSMDNLSVDAADRSSAFADVKDSAWYADCIYTAANIGVITADSQNKVKPEETVSVAELVRAAAIVHQLYYGNTKVYSSGANDFSPYINYAIEHMMLREGMFEDYEREATRLDAAVVLWNVLPAHELDKRNDIAAVNGFDSDSPYYDAVFNMIESGIVVWTEDSQSFEADLPLSRAELASFVERLVSPEDRVSNQ